MVSISEHCDFQINVDGQPVVSVCRQEVGQTVTVTISPISGDPLVFTVDVHHRTVQVEGEGFSPDAYLIGRDSSRQEIWIRNGVCYSNPGASGQPIALVDDLVQFGESASHTPGKMVPLYTHRVAYVQFGNSPRCIELGQVAGHSLNDGTYSTIFVFDGGQLLPSQIKAVDEYKNLPLYRVQ